jgi:hypothetical protein
MNAHSTKIISRALGLAGAGCAAAFMLSSPISLNAEVSEEEFRQLKDVVKQLAEKMQSLEKIHQADVQTHEKDLDLIRQLQTKVDETQKTASTAVAKADAAVGKAEAAVDSSRNAPPEIPQATRNFMILGDTEVQYAKGTGHNGGFVFADFAPIFLYRGNENVLFEAGFDFGLQNNATGGGATSTLNLSFAQLDYVINDYATLIAGNMLLPLGEFSERAAGWLNKIPDSPLGRDLLPGAGIGAQLRGAIPLGRRGISVNYAVWGANGPSSTDGTGAAGSLDLGGNVGLRSDNAIANLHGNPAGGGRVGLFLPWKPHYDIELGVSGQASEWDDAGQHLWSATVLDTSIHLSTFVELKGEYIKTHYGSDDLGNVSTEGYWAQAGYKLAGIGYDLPVLRNAELLYRYDAENTGLGTIMHRNTVGLLYYLTSTLWLEADYEFLHSTDPAGQGYLWLLQLSYGF